MEYTRNIPKEFTKEFLELYRSFPCLWNKKEKDYRDREKKKNTYVKLVNKLKQIDPEADRDLVRMKINTLRTNYRRERNKIEASKKSGLNKVYEPTLWYYNLLTFLDDEDAPRDQLDSDSNDSLPAKDQEHKFQIKKNSELDDISEPECSLPVARTWTVSNLRSQRKTNKLNENIDQGSTDKIGDNSEENTATVPRTLVESKRNEDRFDIFGKYIAHKIRDLPRVQQVYVDKIINEALFEAELGRLKKNSYVYNPVDS